MPPSDIKWGAKTYSVDSDYAVWGVPGLRSGEDAILGLISAQIISRDAGEVNWLSDNHRITLALTDLYGTVSVDGGRTLGEALVHHEQGLDPRRSTRR
jgi:hypothetical protein